MSSFLHGILGCLIVRQETRCLTPDGVVVILVLRYYCSNFQKGRMTECKENFEEGYEVS